MCESRSVRSVQLHPDRMFNKCSMFCQCSASFLLFSCMSSSTAVRVPGGILRVSILILYPKAVIVRLTGMLAVRTGRRSRSLFRFLAWRSPACRSHRCSTRKSGRAPPRAAPSQVRKSRGRSNSRRDRSRARPMSRRCTSCSKRAGLASTCSSKRHNCQRMRCGETDPGRLHLRRLLREHAPSLVGPLSGCHFTAACGETSLCPTSRCGTTASASGTRRRRIRSPRRRFLT